MQELDDIALLRQYTDQNSEEAFAELVSRHINKVYSVALRHTRNQHSAEEITQAVFVILAKKSRQLGKKVVLSGWLYETARLTAATFIRSEIRRARRELEAHMQSLLNENDSDAWPQIAPLLDAAMAGLSETDRLAVVLRFFDGKSMKEVGAALGTSEDAAKMRLNRAMEKLRGFFTKRGITFSSVAIAGTISANSVQAAPVALAKSVTAVAIAKGAAASGSTLTLIQGALKIMAWTKAKTAIVVGVAVILAATTGTIVIKAMNRLEMRGFKVDRTLFDAHLRNATGASSAEPVSEIASNYFVSKGIDFRPPKSIAFNDAHSLLFVKATSSDLKAIEKMIQHLDSAPLLVHRKVYFIKAPENDVESILKAGTVVDTKEDNIVEIMPPTQTSSLVSQLKSSGAVILSVPEVTTLIARQTRMNNGDIIVDSRQTRTSSGDTMVDLDSAISDDGYTLKVKASVSAPENLLANANIWDGQTIVLAPNNSSDGKTRLLVFVTSTLIDAAGNRFHSKLPLNSPAIPPQE